ncbi:hypothetical protein ACLOJK_004342 [Asimina triloba]
MAGQAGAEHSTDHSVITVATHTHRTGQAAWAYMAAPKPASLTTGSSKASVPHDRQPQVASSNPNPSTVLLPLRSSAQAPLIDASQASSGRRSNSPKPNMLGNTSRSASSSIPFDLSHLSPDATRQQQLEQKISVVRQTTNPPKIG